MNLKQEIQRVLHDTSSDSVSKYLDCLCILSTFQYHFQPTRRLYLRASISIRNYPTKLHIQIQIRISFRSLSHIPLVSTLPVTTNILCLTLRTGCVSTVSSYCHPFKSTSSLNISSRNSVDFFSTYRTDTPRILCIGHPSELRSFFSLFVVSYKLGLVDVQVVSWDRWGTVRAGDYIFFCIKGNENHQLRTGFFVHHRLVLAVNL